MSKAFVDYMIVKKGLTVYPGNQADITGYYLTAEDATGKLTWTSIEPSSNCSSFTCMDIFVLFFLYNLCLIALYIVRK